MSGIKRLNIDWTYQEMDPHPEGELVYFDDHAAEIARLRAEADALRIVIKRAWEDVNWMTNEGKLLNRDCFDYLDAAMGDDA